MSRRGDNIRKRADGRWEGRYRKERDSSGKIKYGSVYGKTYKEVKNKLALVIACHDSYLIKKNRAIKFSDVLEIWIENNRIRQKGATTNRYQNLIDTRTYEYRYHKILDYCNIRSINYHALRHTFATRCIESGVDVKTLSEILGHSNVSITLNTYVHSSMEFKRNQIEKLSTLSA